MHIFDTVQRRFLALGALLIFSNFSSLARANSFEDRLQAIRRTSCERLLGAMQLPNAARGATVAAASAVDPNYAYHWTRDAAIVMKAVTEMYREAMSSKGQSGERYRYLGLWVDYIRFSRATQKLNTAASLGEPKYELDGRSFDGPWGRPQNDGPALRVIAAAEMAHLLLDQNFGAYVETELYRPELPARTLIKADLEYLAHHWKEVDFDPWEEVQGAHFFNRMVQRRALLVGARLARRMGDGSAADFYERQASLITQEIVDLAWDQQKKLIRPNYRPSGDQRGKVSDLDVSVILGVLHGYDGDGFFSPADERVLNTAFELERRFSNLYPINRDPSLGAAIGRYPEDVFFDGNAWILATAALAELYFKAGQEFERRGQAERGKAMRAKGDLFLARIEHHTGLDGHLPEQIDKLLGIGVSARHLTWSYASFISALHERSKK